MRRERKRRGAIEVQPLGALGRILSIVTLVALAVSGCGDDGGAGGGNRAEAASAVATNPTSTAHQRFLAEADAICAEANEKEVALGAEGPGWVYTQQFDDPVYLAEFTAVGRAALRRLKALTPPKADGKSMEVMIGSIARMVRALDGRIAALRAGRKDNGAAYSRPYYRAYGDLTSVAGPLGLTECQGLLL